MVSYFEIFPISQGHNTRVVIFAPEQIGLAKEGEFPAIHMRLGITDAHMRHLDAHHNGIVSLRHRKARCRRHFDEWLLGDRAVVLSWL